jgi:hypothetical protein
MAVFVQKFFNRSPSVVTAGVGVAFSKNESLLYVLNANGHRMALFRADSVEKYWIEDNSIGSESLV